MTVIGEDQMTTTEASQSAALSQKPRRPHRGMPRAMWTVTVIAIVLGSIQVVSLFQPNYIFPDLPAIGKAIWEILSQNSSGLLVTLGRFFVGLLGAMTLGWGIGLMMGTFRNTVGEFLHPVFSIMQAVPALSWVLILVIWLRSIELRILFIVLLIGIPFFVIAVYEGIRNIDNDTVEAVAQFRPTRWQVLRYLFIPQSLVYVLITLKNASSFCLRILVFAELIGATTGIGYEMGNAQANFRVDLIFAWTVLLVAFNFIFAGLINVVERRLLRWRREAVIR